MVQQQVGEESNYTHEVTFTRYRHLDEFDAGSEFVFVHMVVSIRVLSLRKRSCAAAVSLKQPGTDF